MTVLRHTLCFLKEQSRPLSAHSTEELGVLNYWLHENYPFILPRQPKDIHDEHIRLAFPFFNEARQEKTRQSYLFAKTAITQYQELPCFNQLFPSITIDSEIKVYGSYCWQYLTGQNYVRSNSDMDLLVMYTDQSLAQLKRLYHQLTQDFQSVPLDGEVRFAHLGDSSWRELIQVPASPTLLMKSYREVALIQREQLYAQFPTLLS